MTQKELTKKKDAAAQAHATRLNREIELRNELASVDAQLREARAAETSAAEAIEEGVGTQAELVETSKRIGELEAKARTSRIQFDAAHRKTVEVREAFDVVSDEMLAADAEAEFVLLQKQLAEARERLRVAGEAFRLSKQTAISLAERFRANGGSDVSMHSFVEKLRQLIVNGIHSVDLLERGGDPRPEQSAARWVSELAVVAIQRRVKRSKVAA
jgi:hypothetical protein